MKTSSTSKNSSRRHDPDQIPRAVEELLRFCGPAQLAIRRFALENMEIAGVFIPQGATVVLSLAAANLDTNHFDDAGELDLGRDAAHLAFGHGIHFCVGAPLARMEASIVFTALLREFAQLSLAIPADKIPWRPWSPLTSLRGPASLPLAISR
jgi:cytochrome P450